jgi:Ca2+-binding RTX toxin-like protein
MEGSLGNDVLKAGAGDDGGLFGDPGNDKIVGGPGNDEMEGEQGADTMLGGPGDDEIDALDEDTGAVDRIACGDGEDFIFIAKNDILLDGKSCEHINEP